MKNQKSEFEIDRKNLELEIDRIKQESLFVYDLLISRYEILFDILHSKQTQENIKFCKQLWNFFCRICKLIVGETRWEKVFFIILLSLILVELEFSYYNILINEQNKA